MFGHKSCSRRLGWYASTERSKVRSFFHLMYYWTLITRKATCPRLDPLADTSTAGLSTNTESSDFAKLINAILFLDITSHKKYSALTRTFLSTFCILDESTISVTLHNPTNAVEAARKKASIVASLGEHAQRN